MTISPESCKLNFKDDSEANTFAAFKQGKTDVLGQTNWEKKWPRWIQALKTTTEHDGKWAKDNGAEVRDNIKLAIGKYVANLADQAWLLAEEITADITAGTEGNENELKNAAASAMCSAPYTAVPSKGGFSDTAETPQKANTCDNGAQNRVGKSIALDLVCLCVTTTNSECLGADGAPDVTGNGNIAANTLNTLLYKCPKT
ncbi:Trypanosomal VSG domain containing protein, putative [Trypanosoma equiperdum]|uniref:Trypanosomal VSG domain containing protein, putative n=1 Tax=Trypanosoma equiperdum TaxID=5694 RepID=A0A1G4IH05_TRYEQ|nr:Trypanosomal VSG domain containing protein, putative [Trypanosoma equiperdum]